METKQYKPQNAQIFDKVVLDSIIEDNHYILTIGTRYQEEDFDIVKVHQLEFENIKEYEGSEIQIAFDFLNRENPICDEIPYHPYNYA